MPFADRMRDDSLVKYSISSGVQFDSRGFLCSKRSNDRTYTAKTFDSWAGWQAVTGGTALAEIFDTGSPVPGERYCLRLRPGSTLTSDCHASKTALVGAPLTDYGVMWTVALTDVS